MLPSHSEILAEAICMSIRPEFRISTDLFLLFAHDHFTKIYGPLSFILFLCTTIRPKVRVVIDLLILFVYDHSTKIYERLSFILSLRTTIQSKVRVLINIFVLFVHDDHSTKVRQGSLLLFNSFFPYCQYFIFYIHSSTTLIFRRLDSWKCCSYISYAICMAM